MLRRNLQLTALATVVLLVSCDFAPATALPSPTVRATLRPTSTPQRTAVPPPTSAATQRWATATSPRATATTTTVAAVTPGSGRAVLANYFPWYDPATWDTGCTSDKDRPRDGVYSSDDEAVIARHIRQAQAAGLDGLAVHWFARDNRTDANLARVLDLSPDGFDSTVTFLRHILPGTKQGDVVDALRYLIATYGQHPRLFRVDGRPVLLFADILRVPNTRGTRPGSDKDVGTAVATWKAIRAAVDPGHEWWWIAEGLQDDYLAVFDGLYVYKIDHECCPNTYSNASRWAGWVRDWEVQTGQDKLWAATVMPGWDDLNSAKRQCADLRVSSEPFARQREDGAYYARTWEAAIASQPDFILVHSFNEWVEGSYIEPSAKYGDEYLTLTAQWAARYRGGE
jgi:hypothetical protein